MNKKARGKAANRMGKIMFNSIVRNFPNFYTYHVKTKPLKEHKLVEDK